MSTSSRNNERKNILEGDQSDEQIIKHLRINQQGTYHAPIKLNAKKLPADFFPKQVKMNSKYGLESSRRPRIFFTEKKLRQKMDPQEKQLPEANITSFFKMIPQRMMKDHQTPKSKREDQGAQLKNKQNSKIVQNEKSHSILNLNLDDHFGYTFSSRKISSIKIQRPIPQNFLRFQYTEENLKVRENSVDINFSKKRNRKQGVSLPLPPKNKKKYKNVSTDTEAESKPTKFDTNHFKRVKMIEQLFLPKIN